MLFYNCSVFICSTVPRCKSETNLVVIDSDAHPWLSAQSAQMSKITNDGLTWLGTGYFIAVPIWQQLVSRVNDTYLWDKWIADWTYADVLPVVWVSIHLTCGPTHWATFYLSSTDCQLVNHRHYSLQWLVRLLMIYSWVYLPSVLWYCWLGLLTCKNRLPYNLYCVGGDVKHCSLTHSLSWKYSGRGGLVDSRYHMCELYCCCNHVLLRVLLSVAHSMTLDTVNCSSQGM